MGLRLVSGPMHVLNDATTRAQGLVSASTDLVDRVEVFNERTRAGSHSSIMSFRSVYSVLSWFSAGSALSIASAGSFGSVGSAGSLLSFLSAGSVLSVGSAGSILSIGSTGSVGAIGGSGQFGPKARAAVRSGGTVLAAVALLTAAVDRR